MPLICPACRAEFATDAPVCTACGSNLAGVLRQGHVIAGRYEIFSPLGRGGMGIVYKAHDRVLDEPVAMKVLRSDFDESLDLEERFRAEIKLARKVSHRNVCRIHEYGQDGSIHYICMELVTGTELRALLRKEGRLGTAEAFDIGIQTALGLEAIHEMGVIHRDLKTSNIMRDHRGVVRLMDFGIAKQWGVGTAAGVTLAGQIIGTPEYMSPEQARGEKIDLRSDIYSLGIVLFELFTGHVPFHATTPLATIFQHLQNPPPLSGPEAEGIPDPLIPVLQRALAKEPGQRFQSVADAVAALRLARAEALGTPGEPVTPKPSETHVFPREGAADPFPTPVPPPTSVSASASLNPPAPIFSERPAKIGPPPAPPQRTPRPPPPPPAVPPPRVLPVQPPERGTWGWLWVIPVIALVVIVGVMLAREQRGPSDGRSDASPSPISSPDTSSLVSGGARIANVATPAASPTLPAPSEAPSLPPSPRPSPFTRTTTTLGGSTGPSSPRSPLPGPSPKDTSPVVPPPAATGLLQLVVRPWAEVAVEGRTVGHTPLRKFPLPVGSHLVVLTHPQFRPLQRRVTITPGATTLLEVDLRSEAVPLPPSPP